jgi:hypothetical protein
MFTVAPNFDEHPKIRQLLTESHVPPDARLAHLADAITLEEWVQARDAGNENAWRIVARAAVL